MNTFGVPLCVNFVNLSCRTSERLCDLVASKFEFDLNYISNNCVLYRRRRCEDSEGPSNVGSGGSGTSTGSLPSPPKYCIVCYLLVLYNKPYATQYFPSLRCILDDQCLLNDRRVFEVRTRFCSRAVFNRLFTKCRTDKMQNCNCVLYRRRRCEDSEGPSSVGSGGSGTSTGSLPSPPKYCIVCDFLVLYNNPYLFKETPMAPKGLTCDCTQSYAMQYFPSLRCILDDQCLLNDRRVFEVRTRFCSRAKAVFLIGYSQNAELQKRQFLVSRRPHVNVSAYFIRVTQL